MAKRAIVMVMDSFGIGSLPDANLFGDEGSNTFGNIVNYCSQNNQLIQIPNLLKLGLGRAYRIVNGKNILGDNNDYILNGCYGAAKELSSGKDTTSGHWEIAGCPVLFDWGYFKDLNNTFPQNLLNEIMQKTGIKGYLGNCHASGTDIIKNIGEEHIKTGYPIFYSSADSVFQIACHEEYFGLENLYNLCKEVRIILEPYNIARVIARPFIGNSSENFIRTANRHDYSLLPPHKTLLDICQEEGGQVIAIGKIGDIYAHSGTGVEIKASGLEDLCQKTIDAINTYDKDKTFIMTNLVDFDMLYGHRRDVIGYKNSLEHFDSILPSIIKELKEDDILILTADHGCDPTWNGSDHTREYIPILMYHSGKNKEIGIRETFADIGQSIAEHLSLSKLNYGTSFIV
jgi:phosphopentomutase